MYKINFNHLYYFLTISKEGSIVKASKKLNITQPALSHQLKILEQDLGKPLFDRVGRRLVINKDGESVKAYASKIFRHSEEMLQVLKSKSEELIQIIKIGTVPWLSKDQVYGFIKPLLFNKQVKVQVYQQGLETLLDDVKNDRLDIILCDSPYSGRTKKLQGHRLSTDPILCVASSKSIFKGKFPGCIEGKKTITYSEDCMMSEKIDKFLNEKNLSVDVIGKFTDSALMRVIIESGEIIGFLPFSVANEGLKKKSLIEIAELKGLDFSLWAITRNSHKKDSIIGRLLDEYKSIYKCN